MSVNGEKVPDVNAGFAADSFGSDGLMIKKGKKVFHRALLG